MNTEEEILEKVLECGSNDLKVFGGRYEGGYRIMQNPPEIAAYIAELQKRFGDNEIENYLEIGVAGAGLTRLQTDFIKVKNVYTVDLGTDPNIPLAYHDNVQAIKSNISGSFNEFIGDSHSEQARVFVKAIGEIDYAFIDGDHSYNGALQDVQMVMPFMKKNGIVAFHDHIAVKDIRRLTYHIQKGRIANLELVNDFVGDDKCKGLIYFKVI